MFASLKRAAVGLAVLLLVACASPVTGTVVAHEYKEAYTYTEMVPIYGTTCDAKGNCSSTIQYWMPTQRYVPEKFRIQVQEDDGDLRWVTVSEADYSAYEDGEWFTNDPDAKTF